MGFYLLNISVDTADPNPEYIAEDLTYNDQESIIEIIVEKILGYENAIKEYDDNDSDSHRNKTNIKIDLIDWYTTGYIVQQPLVEKETQGFPYYNTCLTSGFQKPDTPPPQV